MVRQEQKDAFMLKKVVSHHQSFGRTMGVVSRLRKREIQVYRADWGKSTWFSHWREETSN